MTHSMNMKRTLYSLLATAVVLLLTAVDCHENDPIIDPTDITFTYGGYFLNSGQPGRGDAELTQLNTLQSSVTPRAFGIYNDGKALGDKATDIHILGNKLYVTLSGSRQIRVIDKFNCKEIATISVASEETGNPLTPNYLTSFEEALIVSFEEGYLARIDTVSFKPSLIVPVGDAPRQITIANQKLYVVNALDGSNPGHVVQMLNPVDLHVMKNIEVAPNPEVLVMDPADGGDLYLISSGDGTTPACFQRIDSDSEAVTVIQEVTAPRMVAAGTDKALVIYAEDHKDDLGGRFYVFNTDNQRIEGEFIRDGSYVRNPCMVVVDQNAGTVYIAENAGSYAGTIYIYTSYGQYLTSFNTGAANPCAAAFVTGR